MLLYADDLVLFGDNIGHLQKILCNRSVFCNKWGLPVSMSETKFMEKIRLVILRICCTALAMDMSGKIRMILKMLRS